MSIDTQQDILDQQLLKEFFEFKRFKELALRQTAVATSVAPPSPIVSSVQTPVQTEVSRRKNNWTLEDDKALLDGVAEFGFKWTKIQKKYPFLVSKGAVAALRHRYMIVKEQLDEGTIKCPKCKTKITEKVFLGCTCGVDNDQLMSVLVDNTGWIHAGKYGITRRIDSVTLAKLFGVETTETVSDKVFLGNKWVSVSELQHYTDIWRNARHFEIEEIVEPYVTKTLHREIGILCGTLSDEVFFYQKHVCYRVGEMICKCKIPCTLRHRWNDLAGLPCYAPFSPLGIKPRYRNPETCPDIDYFSGTIGDKDYFEKVVQRNKKLKGKTISTYLESLRWLEKYGFFDREVVPREFVKRCQLLCETSQNTLMIRLSVISIYFSNLRDDELLTLYGERGKEVRLGFYREVGKLQHMHVQRKDNQMTEREEKNWLDFDVLEAKLIEYLSKNKGPYDEPSAVGVIIAALHILQTPLRGYHSVMISGYNPDTDNYLVIGDTPATSYFMFNKFKTDKTFGPSRLVVKEAVYGMLKEIVSRKQGNYLFTVLGKPNEPMSVPVYSQYLGNFIEELTGKRIASQMIRKIYVSFVRKDELTAEQNRQLSETLQHSEKMSRGVYRVVKKA